MSYELTLLTVALPVALAIAVIAMLTMRRRMPPKGALSRVESWVTSFVGAGAMLTTVFGVFGVVSAAVRSFGEDPYRVQDMPYGGSPVERLEGVPAIVDSWYESVGLSVAGVPGGARWLFFAESALPSLATVAIGVAVTWLAFALIRERPFVRAVPHVIGVAAIAIMVAGIGSQFAAAFGRAAVVDYLGNAEVTTDSDGTGALTYFALGLDLAPIGWAFGLALVAAAFQIGSRLQRETDLLV